MKRVVVVLGWLGCAVPTGKARPDTDTAVAGDDDEAALNDDVAEPSIAEECEVTEAEVALDALLPIGFSVVQLMDDIAGSTAHAAWYPDGTDTEITVTLQLREGTAVFVEQVVPGTETRDDICFDYVRVPVNVVMATGDNAIVFDLSSELRVQDGQTHSLDTGATPVDNRGTHTIELLAGDTGSYRIEQVVTEDAVTGAIHAVVETVDGDLALVTQDLLLQWPEAD